MPPLVSAPATPAKLSPVRKIQPYYIQHTCDQVHRLLVDFNLGEDLEDKKDGKCIIRTVSCMSILILELHSLPFLPGNYIFVSRAVEWGGPVPLTTPNYVPKVPRIPECYANAHAHSKQINDFLEEIKTLVDLDKLTNQSQDNGWRHELNHNVESVFWHLLYWAMVTQPEGHPGGYFNAHS
jgi:hypothetical protein